MVFFIVFGARFGPILGAFVDQKSCFLNVYFSLIFGLIFDWFWEQKWIQIVGTGEPFFHQFSILFRRVAPRTPKTRILWILEGFGMELYRFVLYFDVFLVVFWHGLG